MKMPIITIVRDDGLGDRNPRFAIDGHPWTLLRGGLEGFDGLEHEVTTQAFAQYDGSSVVWQRAPEVDRTVSFGAVGSIPELRGEVDSFFRPSSAYEVHVDAEGRRRFAHAVQLSLRQATDNQSGVQLVTWTFLSPDPLWLSDDERSFDLAKATRRFGFPFVSYKERVAPTMLETDAYARSMEKHVGGFLAGVLAKEYRLVNAGAATAYPRFEIRASAAVTNPTFTIRDRSGRAVCTFGVAKALRKDDVLVVDFSARPTTIALNGSNISNLATPGSTLATGIEPGEYSLSWDADSGSASLSIVPTIRERYLSI